MASADRDHGDFTAAPLIDAAMLEGLRAALGPATDQLLARATDVLEDRMSQLAALADDPLDENLARLAHEIGGVAGQIGLARLARAALALERFSRDGDSLGAAEALDGVRAVDAETRMALAG